MISFWFIMLTPLLLAFDIFSQHPALRHHSAVDKLGPHRLGQVLRHTSHPDQGLQRQEEDTAEYRTQNYAEGKCLLQLETIFQSLQMNRQDSVWFQADVCCQRSAQRRSWRRQFTKQLTLNCCFSKYGNTLKNKKYRDHSD